MKKEDKGKIVEQLTVVIKKYPNFYLTDIETLNAERTSILRRECFKQNVKLIVVKNTLLKKTFEKLEGDYLILDDSLKGQTAIMLSHSANTPARLIFEFAKSSKKRNETIKPELKAAYVHGSFYIGAEYLDALVNIKGKDELLGDVIMLLQSSSKNVISALLSSKETIGGTLKALERR
ncbi:MAG: 50S ribosomal protein L10 [Tannerellaceae bacterium]|jgi:large subunit ribosomal protein L10|nr:50S ribosomal protein L10 [Tannerellaceae bacterium]